MKRFALLAAAVLGTGCVSEAPGDIAVYWNFSRHTSTGTAFYDVADPTNLSGPCRESRVQYVQVFDGAGNALGPMDDCVIENPQYGVGVQGFAFLDFSPGTYSIQVRGYRNILGIGLVEVHRGLGTVQVYGNQLNPVTITAAGIQDSLDVFLYQGASLFNCLGGDSLGYTLQDSRPVTPTIIDQFSGLACGNPISFAGVDLDNLDIRVQVSNSGNVVLDSCVSQPFGHFGNDTGLTYGWPVALYTAPCP